MLLTAAKHRAKTRGLPFKITEDDIIVPDTCPVLGIPLQRNKKGKTHNGNSPSLDRLIPEFGYVPGNVQVISMRANLIKSNASVSELRQVADWCDTQLRSGTFMT